MDHFHNLQQLKNDALIKMDPWLETEYAPMDLQDEDFDQCPECADWVEVSQIKRDGICWNCIRREI